MSIASLEKDVSIESLGKGIELDSLLLFWQTAHASRETSGAIGGKDLGSSLVIVFSGHLTSSAYYTVRLFRLRRIFDCARVTRTMKHHVPPASRAPRFAEMGRARCPPELYSRLFRVISISELPLSFVAPPQHNLLSNRFVHRRSVSS